MEPVACGQALGPQLRLAARGPAPFSQSLACGVFQEASGERWVGGWCSSATRVGSEAVLRVLELLVALAAVTWDCCSSERCPVRWAGS